ncbi:hypothetical protein ACL97_00620 [Staphylococcus aureus]
MEIFETILIFIAVVILSSFVHTFIPKVPLAFIQIFLGMLLFITPIPVQFNFDSELFMVTMIAPLLFVEGVNVSRVHLRKYIISRVIHKKADCNNLYTLKTCP